jgi:hypothetical protein
MNTVNRAPISGQTTAEGFINSPTMESLRRYTGGVQ